jgi:hypothetical protein
MFFSFISSSSEDQKSVSSFKPGSPILITEYYFLIRKTLEQAYTDLTNAQGVLATKFKEMDKENIATLNVDAQAALAELFANGSPQIQAQIEANNQTIAKLQNDLKALKPTTTAVEVQDSYGTLAGIPPAPTAPPADPTVPDYWTTITFEVSSSYSAEQTSSSANSYSVGGGASWG